MKWDINNIKTMSNALSAVSCEDLKCPDCPFFGDRRCLIAAVSDGAKRIIKEQGMNNVELTEQFETMKQSLCEMADSLEIQNKEIQKLKGKD